MVGVNVGSSEGNTDGFRDIEGAIEGSSEGYTVGFNDTDGSTVGSLNGHKVGYKRISPGSPVGTSELAGRSEGCIV